MRTSLLLSCLFALCLIAGCKTGGDDPSPPVTASVTIVAPANGSTIKSQPITLSANFSNGADPTDMTALLDGVDITAKFAAADSSGTRTAQVGEPDVNYGKNQLQIRIPGTKVNSSFIFDPALGASTGSEANAATFLVPVRTRVLRNDDPTVATNWGITVGDTTYWSNVPIDSGRNPCPSCNRGFQILFLNRQDLSLVSNISYSVESPPDIYTYSPFSIAIGDAAEGVLNGCENGGCITVMQSLTYVGYAPCYGSTVSPDCANYSSDAQHEADFLSQIGASDIVLYADYRSSNVAYSFIGNAASGNNRNTVGGTQYERLGCSDTRYQNSATICDSMGNFSPSLNSAPNKPDQLGDISGVLIRDNYNSFTYSPNAPDLSYIFGTTAANATFTNVVRINGGITEGNGQYSMSMPKNSRGGFRLLILDRNNPAATSCLSCSTGAKRFDQFFDVDTGLPGLMAAILNGGSGTDANSLIFLASMGDISHLDTDARLTRQWNELAQVIQTIGGDPLTFKMVGLKINGASLPIFDQDGKDDYLLVGRPLARVYTNSMPPFHGEETGYAITRHTLSNATSPTSVEGVLALDHEGYYAPRLQGPAHGMMTPQIASLASASLRSAIPWPMVSTTGQRNAYSWISSELCCSDIRASYINLNVSPEIWLTQLYQLTYPSDQQGSFSASDFDDVRDQLAIEFNYVALVRNLQTNILSLYQSQQSNVALILEQAEDEVESNIYTSAPPPQPPTAWKAFTTDVFPVLDGLTGFLPAGGHATIQTALGIGTLMINSSVGRSNDADGNSQIMISLASQDIAASKLAQHVVDQYTDSLVTLGNDFNRILSDWGRLKTLGGPLASGQLQWDNTAQGFFLRAFNLTARRQFYPALMANNSNYFVTHIQYGDYQYFGSDDHNVYNSDQGCTQSAFHDAQDNDYAGNYVALKGTAWYPGNLQSGKANGSTAGIWWWDIWALGLTPGTNDQCPLPASGVLPSSFGMFDPINQNSTTGLGLWKPYFFERWTGTVYPHQNQYFGGNVP